MSLLFVTIKVVRDTGKATADWSRRETGGDSQQHQQTAHHSTGKENPS